MHFGLEAYVPYVLYVSAFACLVASLWRPMVGIYYLLPLLPLQTIRYRTNDLPLGSSIVGFVLVGVAVGLMLHGKSLLPKSRSARAIWIYVVFTFVSLCLGALYLGGSMPLPGDQRFGFWQEYTVMPAMMLLIIAAAPTKRQIQVMIALMCLATLALDKSFWNEISGRDFSVYTEELHREGGSMGYAGTNGLAAFAAQFSTLLLALAAFEKRFLLKAAYYALSAFSLICLMYSLSRGGYVAVIAGVAVIALLKQRKLLPVLVLFLLTWTSLVPAAVEQRVQMTYDHQSDSLDNSTTTRLSLWKTAMQVFDKNPIVGTGFDTYEFMRLNKITYADQGYYADTHNYFVKVLVETGVIGFLLLIWIIVRFLADGLRLFHKAHDPFYRALGLGLVGWITCAVVANLFGDRWTFLQVNGYMWALGGMVGSLLLAEEHLGPEGSAVKMQSTAKVGTRARPLRSASPITI